MKVFVEQGGVVHEHDAAFGASALDVLQEHGYHITATCGGAGKCLKCQVMIRDAQGVRHALACTTPVTDGMLVVLEEARAMDVVDSGIAVQFTPDEGLWGYGVAIDIGTTTLAAHLHDLATGVRVASVSRANPQIAYGADVISRITASMEGKLDKMTGIIIAGLDEMVDKLCEQVSITRADIARCAIAGNTVMQHIACALPPDTIGVNPFTPLTLFGDEHDLGPLGICYLAPCVAGYVGGDITAGMLARELDDGRTRLFLDLGTNGEMALSHDGRIICCATAAGPVFEGANVRFGMPAGPGAINQVSLVDGELRLGILGDEAPIGICGTGIIDSIALLVEAGLVDETGYLLDADEAEGPLAERLGEEDDGNVFYLTDDHAVFITQNDVRSLQLAKAAVCAGIETMMDAYQVTCDQIESLEIAGGFGKFLNMQAAARVGLFPAELVDRASSVGNTSAEGATAMMLSIAARERAERIVHECDYLELSTSAAFNGFYIEQMEFAE